jgi:DNA-binding PadR family transcriptional regulator
MQLGVKEGLLALLSDGPRHGYQLKLDLETATGESISINVGQIYSTLQRLERDRLIEDGGKDSDGRDIYQITTVGRDSLAEWALEAVDLAAAGRDEISLKVLIALSTDSLDPRVVIEHQRRFTMGLLQDLTQLRGRDIDSDLAWQLHLDRLTYSAEAELKWLDRVEERLETAKVPERTTHAEAPVEEGV